MAAFPMAAFLPGASAEPVDEFTSDLVAARVTVGQLARWAQRYLITHHAEETGSCPCGGARCALADIPGGQEACRLAGELAWLPVAETREAPPSRAGTRPEEVAQLYVQALRNALGAVFYCQRVQHLMGDCWFSGEDRPGEALCARTLAITHVLWSGRRTLI